MIEFDADGVALGTLRRGNLGELIASTPEVVELVQAKRDAWGLTDEQIYAWFSSGALDNGYVRATEVA